MSADSSSPSVEIERTDRVSEAESPADRRDQALAATAEGLLGALSARLALVSVIPGRVDPAETFVAGECEWRPPRELVDWLRGSPDVVVAAVSMPNRAKRRVQRYSAVGCAIPGQIGGRGFVIALLPVAPHRVPQGSIDTVRAFAALVAGYLGDERRATERDELTGCLSRGAVLDALTEEIARCERYGRALAVAFLDLDDFKATNDAHGHRVGDHVLAAKGQALRESVRPMDRVGRYGGDEFLVLMPETGVGEALGAARRWNDALVRVNVAGAPKRGASVGVAEWSHGVSLEDLVDQADRRMLDTKHSSPIRHLARRGRRRRQMFAPTLQAEPASLADRLGGPVTTVEITLIDETPGSSVARITLDKEPGWIDVPGDSPLDAYRAAVQWAEGEVFATEKRALSDPEVDN